MKINLDLFLFPQRKQISEIYFSKNYCLYMLVDGNPGMIDAKVL